MNFARKICLLLSLATILSLSAGAQETSATFVLPQDAYVAHGVLPAGRYTVSLSLEGVTKMFITSADGKGVAAIALPVSTDSYAACNGTSLSLQREGGDWSLRSVCFAQSQVALYFAPRGQKTAVASASPAAEVLTGSR